MADVNLDRQTATIREALAVLRHLVDGYDEGVDISLGVYPTGAKAMVYTVPLDDNRQAQLWLPFNLRAEDAERMAAFIESLVTDDA